MFSGTPKELSDLLVLKYVQSKGDKFDFMQSCVSSPNLENISSVVLEAIFDGFEYVKLSTLDDIF
jgi:hypothetical protein